MSTKYPVRLSFTLALSLMVAFFLSATEVQAKFLVDATLGEVKAEEKVVVSQPRAVQLLFEFQTDGVTNAKATKEVGPILTEELKATGIIATISETPIEGGDTLSIVINNITEKGAASKGFKAGLTFGLAGVLVADNYDAQFSYRRGTNPAPITRTVQHRIYFKFGSKKDPENAVVVKNAKAAVRLMLHQTVAHGMNRIAADPAFAPSSAVATTQ